MNNPWKLATIALALTGVTATAAGLTTAYVLRPAAPGDSAETTVGHPVVRHSAVAVRPPGPTSAPRASTLPIARVSTPAASAPASADCATASGRAMRIAKPGAIGALLGAGLGAASGAIADGGKSAGKGAAIGGIAGAVLGAGYGAYQTQGECGTVFGHRPGGSGPSVPGAGEPTQSAFGEGAPLTVYRAR